MRAVTRAIGLGLRRGLIIYRQVTFSREGLFNNVFWYGLPVVVFIWLRDETFPGVDISVGAVLMPGICAAIIALSAINPAFYLSTEREDGTLLRARAVPNGLVGYITGVLTYASLDAILGLVLIVISGLILLPGLEVAGLTGWATFAIVTVLGLLAVLPFGIVIGSIIRNPRVVAGVTFLIIGAMVAISGVFVPLTMMPDVLQLIAQALPVYWLGLGLRSVFLPDAAVVLEIGESWRRVETVLVLTAYAIAGSFVALGVLRRMARRESGSAVEARRREAMQRI
jgi:ABC-2 type transport system permease protein